MDPPKDGAISMDDARRLVEEVLRVGVALTDLVAGLIETLPEDAFPGEETGEVLVEMVVGSIYPAAESAGATAVGEATALVGAIHDRVSADLRAVAALTKGSK
jgi:hypothetical protein